MRFSTGTFGVVCAASLLGSVTGPAGAADWPAWRGPRADGTSEETDFPLFWSPTNNVRWRVDLPDRGNGSPIVAGGRVYVTQATTRDHRRFVAAYDRRDGRLLWEAGTVYREKEETHEDNPYAAGSPVTDGSRVVASFGSAGVFAFDPSGRELWRRDLGRQQHQWGYASSPVIRNERVYVYHGPGPGSKVVALNVNDGRIVWDKAFPEPVPLTRTDGFKGRTPGVVGGFGTPLAVSVAGREHLILGQPGELIGLDALTGAELWSDPGLNPLVYTSPLAVGDTVVAMGGYSGSSVAVRVMAAAGKVEARRVWYEERSKKNRIGSAVAKGRTLYLVDMDGFFEAVDLATGELVLEERLDGPGAADASWSSVTLAGDRIYAVNRSGDTFVIRASREFGVIAVNSVGEPTNASPAMSDGEIFLRTWTGLWCISEKGKLAAR
ncbi:MAG: PQQ-binding-like beta-propeller repeat protein [Verrucomicrobiales bacterium]|nr:PQQ-binding-like beta-propeller repeat protein [Verrucomicrobiales bacterium]